MAIYPLLRSAVLGAALTVALVPPDGALAQSPSPAATIRDTVLANGLRVIAVRNQVIPAVTVNLAFRNGAFTQLDLEEEGLPHLIEHMLFRAYGSNWSSKVADLDGVSNALTGRETVSYYVIAPPEKLEPAIELVARLVRRPKFEHDDLEDERLVVMNELERNASDPSYLLNFYTDRMLFGRAFRQANIGGNLASIQRATTNTLKDHYERYYVPNNAALVVTGDLTPDDVFAAAEEHFGGWDREADPFEEFHHPPVQPLTGDTIFVVRPEVPNVTLSVAWQGPSVDQDPVGAVAADLFSEIVTQHVSGAYSRLVDTGLFHFLSFSYTPSNHVGPIRLVARTVPEKAALAAQALRNEISLMDSASYFDDDELEMAKMSLRAQAAHDDESAVALAHTLAGAWSLGGVDYFEQTLARESAVGAEDVRRFVARYITEKPKALIMMVSPATIRAHEQVLVTALDVWMTQ